MKSPDLNAEPVNDERPGRVIASPLLILWVISIVVSICRDQSVPALYGILPIFCYVVVSGFLMTWIASRLYRLHGVREFKLDLANLILLSILIALPLSVSSVFWEIFEMEKMVEMKENKTLFLLLLTFIAAFFQLPIFFLTEAVISWWSRTFKSRDH